MKGKQIQRKEHIIDKRVDIDGHNVVPQVFYFQIPFQFLLGHRSSS